MKVSFHSDHSDKSKAREFGKNRRSTHSSPSSRHRVKPSVGLTTAAPTTRALRFDPATIAGNQIEKEDPSLCDSDAVSPDKDALLCSLGGVKWENAVAKSLRS